MEDKQLEDRFLLYCSQTSLGKNLTKAARLINYNLDWGYIVRKTLRNAVFPQVYHNLTELKGNVDKGNSSFWRIFGKMQAAWYAMLSSKLVLYSELRNILQVLKANEIDFLPLKGVALAEAVYSKKELRQFSDIDLLLRNRGETEKAEKLLLKLGYHLDYPIPAFAYEFKKEKHGLTIEFDLHHFLPGWSEYYSYPMIIDLWDAPINATIEGVHTSIMMPEKMLLALSLHSFRHRIFTLRDLCDTIEILKRFPLFNWRIILEHAQEEAWRYILLTFLSLVSYSCKRLEIDLLPKGLLDRINNGFLNLSLYKNLEFPKSYTFLCYGCNKKCKHCPVIIKENIEKWRTGIIPERVAPFFWIYFWESALIFRFVHSPGTSLKCYQALTTKLIKQSKLIRESLGLY